MDEIVAVGVHRRHHFRRSSPTSARALLLLGAVLVGGCRSEQSPRLAAARTQGLRAGFSIEPPFAFIDRAGEPTGEAPEILRRTAHELDIEEIQWFPLPFHDLIPALVGGRIDVIASGLFVTPERSQRVRFSRPTSCVRPVLVMRRVSPAPESGDDCEHCRIAVVQGSVEERAFKRQGRSDRDLIVVPDVATATVAVTEGSADALAISAPTARAIVRQDSALALEDRLLPERVAEEARGCAALAFRLADAELTAAFDSVLERFVGSAAHLELVAPFGFTGTELPCSDGTAAGPDGCALAADRGSR